MVVPTVPARTRNGLFTDVRGRLACVPWSWRINICSNGIERKFLFPAEEKFPGVVNKFIVGSKDSSLQILRRNKIV